MNHEELEKQFNGTVFPKLVESHVKSMSDYDILNALNGTMDEFSVEYRQKLDDYTEKQMKNWIMDLQTQKSDLGDLFVSTSKDIEQVFSNAGLMIDKEKVFNVLI